MQTARLLREAAGGGMIQSVHFKNFKALREAVLPLSPLTLIVGPNGSGKSTALQALRWFLSPNALPFESVISAGARQGKDQQARIEIAWGPPYDGTTSQVYWTPGTCSGPVHSAPGSTHGEELNLLLAGIRVYALDAARIAAPVVIQPGLDLGSDGSNLAGILDQLNDRCPERFEALNQELRAWLPEFDRVLFDVPTGGQKAIRLRAAGSTESIEAAQLSQGTVLALCMLTLAYLPTPPTVACFEEPDRGIHPRLLRRVQDALYRLAYPEDTGQQRAPVQVVATTHSPFFLDLFSEHPEEVVIAEKKGLDAVFQPLNDLPYRDEILDGARLGDIWYTGVLGGVPAGA